MQNLLKTENAVTYVAQLILDGDVSNDELAKDICETINQGQMLAAEIVPAANVLYKFNPRDKLNQDMELPNTFALYQNYPNPFNPSTHIIFDMVSDGYVSLIIYDLTGREVITLVDENKSAGKYNVEFDATGLPSGIYFYRLQAGTFVETKRMILLK